MKAFIKTNVKKSEIIKVGLIGYRNHAKKLLALLEKNPLARVDVIYHPTKVIEDDQ